MTTRERLVILAITASVVGTLLSGESRAQQMQMPMEPPASGIKMADEPVPDKGVPRTMERVGGQPLPFRLIDGVKVFEPTARPVKWKIQSMQRGAMRADPKRRMERCDTS